jgi:nucleotide-binding universal stress UspA family protein
MDYKTLAVHLELGQANDGLLDLTADLAQKLKAYVIGIASCQPIRLDFADGYLSAEILAEDRKEIERQIKEAEAAFHAKIDGKAAGTEWRSTVTIGSLAGYVAQQSRAADLIITGPDIGGSVLDQTRRVNIADLVMEAGRPCLIVPKGHNHLALDRVLIAWKATRECRRAVADALPLLKLAYEVSVIEMTTDEEISRAKHHVADVAAWLGRHGIKAKSEAAVTTDAESDQLREIAGERQVGLVVAGAYGHSRIREWTLGGVTRDFLMNPDRCVLVSH